MHAFEYCQRLVATSEWGFITRFRWLSHTKRAALTVLYAYCLQLDDMIRTGRLDSDDDTVATAVFDWWQQELTKVFRADATPEHPVMQALQTVVNDYGLPENELAAILQGMTIAAQPRYATFADVQHHAQQVAGMRERLSARILGSSHPQTLDYADRLGLALYLTHLIRDVGEAARSGRIELPMTDLQRFNVPARDILSLAGGEHFQALMAFEIDRAETTYREAIALLPRAEAKSQKAGLMLAAVNYALLQEIKADGAANILRYKLAIPKPRQTRIALKTWLWGFRP